MNHLVIQGWKPENALDGRVGLNMEIDQISGQWPELSRIEMKRLIFTYWRLSQKDNLGEGLPE